MKKFFVAIIAILYLSTSIGATIHFHYCMGRLIDWGLMDRQASTCGNCGMEKVSEAGNECCKDETKLIKIENDQKLSENYTQSYEIMPGIMTLPSYRQILLPRRSGTNLIKCTSPPGSTTRNIFNCVFRI